MLENPTVPALSADVLKRFGLFSGLNDSLLTALALELPTRRAEPGEVVVSEGEAATEMYFVVSGELEVVKSTRSGNDVRVALFGPGDWFGEMAVLDIQPRYATVRSVAPTVLLRLRASDIDRILKEADPVSLAAFYRNIARELSRRLRVADGILAHFFTQVADAYVGRRR